MNKAPICGHELCGQRAKGHRGLCDNCYNTRLRQIRTGKTTWDRLIEEGQAYPSNREKKNAKGFLGNL